MIVITGGSGFIGSRLCSLLCEEGYPVRIIDIAPPPPGTTAEFVRASVLDFPRMHRLFAGAEAVIHLAALVDVQGSIADPFSDFQVNAGGTLNVLEAARKAGVEKVLYSSSAAVYGNPKEIPIAESHPTAPLSPYGLSKLTAERYVLLYNSLYGMKNVALRLFNVYGEGQRPSSPYAGVVAKFAEAFSEGRQPEIFGSGRQTRDFVHISDVARAFELALHCDGFGFPLNIGSGKETSLIELVELMVRIAGKKTQPVFREPKAGDIARSCADISLARQKIGYCPSVSLEEGLRSLLCPEGRGGIGLEAI
ncbi:MAG: NAD-dependent epimerase/dehydratase family protein [Candidatus Micrarchaeota archaeon]|nr:NAD-dependent epimerase/dehydratase family protein [Candidatus Micrarchaeota archaeon]